MDGPICVFLWFIICLQVKCEDKVVKSKNPLPYFRRQVEEITDEPTSRSTLSDNSNLVSFLIKNVKRIFDDVELQELSSSVTSNAVTAISEITHKIESSSENNNHSNMTTVNFDSTITVTRTEPPTLDNSSSTSLVINLNEMVQYRNLTVEPTFADKRIIDLKECKALSTTAYELAEKEELMHLSKNLIFYETDRRTRDNYSSFRPNTSNTANVKGTAGNIRSCIFCNNVGLEDCNDPSNRLIPSTVCERDDDVCYTQHTPFGVIDRGCFNVNHNLTTYVCACNLCNYISISEMPHTFPTKLDWLDNVVELARMRQFGKSVFKDMSCLKCESNASAKGDHMLDTANCLEGNIGSLPTQECEENEVCAVKVIKNNGYLWRGCVKTPLFNYWWALCDSDLCNYDPVISIYDIQ